MPPGFSALAPVRKEVRNVSVGASPHIIDRLVADAGAAKLESNQRGEIAMGFCPAALHNSAALHSTRHLAGNVFPDFECGDPDMGTHRDDELGGVVRKRPDRLRYDPGHSTAPTCMHGANVPAQGVCD